MFRHQGVASDFGGHRNLPGLRCRYGVLRGMLTLIAARIEWFHVLPLKGGTFCFPDPIVDAMAQMRASWRAPNSQLIAK
jgi:hypothetical protein